MTLGSFIRLAASYIVTQCYYASHIAIALRSVPIE